MFKRLMLLALLCLPSFVAAQAATVTLLTEEYSPFSYREGKVLKGASIEQVDKIMTAVGVDYSIEMVPWTRAYSQAQTTPMSCVFTTAHSPQRDQIFKWIEPLLVDRNILVAKVGSSVSATDLDDAKKYTVGTHRGDYTETLLKEKGFTRIDLASDFNGTLRKLLNGRVDLMPISEPYFEKIKAEQPLRRVALLASQAMGIACEKSFPEDLRAKMQDALSKLIADGTQKEIFARYGLHTAE
ncbi:transporter substrate-binding domain-containing protein [Rhizobium grahamii]|uniref:Transporter substrate-binding domain-containing protein n=1 Tax=Rhizobium grahamii TaxID=1120045 RepID=A0A5Q0C9V5_9HYPH|nr:MULTISPECIES: transporter substrate-binding domain-containing protein [Rhizobium]QFY60780.1 transporter substrate-binding domain-containing protein [Rhizobium grahamii]QRM50076.1 transporter substrate-binding domain-containing protein [Rhizobium sp. BG6]